MLEVRTVKLPSFNNLGIKLYYYANDFYCFLTTNMAAVKTIHCPCYVYF